MNGRPRNPTRGWPLSTDVGDGADRCFPSTALAQSTATHQDEPLSQSRRELEAICIAWVKIGGARGAWDHGFRLLVG